MKILSPPEIQTQVNTAKEKKFTPAGKEGLKRLKLSCCHALRKASEKISNTLSEDTAIVSAIGFGVLGFSALEKMSTGQTFSSGVLIPSAIAASLPLVSNAAEKTSLALRNLEAKLTKELRLNKITNQAIITKSGLEF